MCFNTIGTKNNNRADTKWRIFAKSLHLLSPNQLSLSWIVLMNHISALIMPQGWNNFLVNQKTYPLCVSCIPWDFWPGSASKSGHALLLRSHKRTHMYALTLKAPIKKEVPVSFAGFLHMNPAGDQLVYMDLSHSMKFMWK